MPSTSIEDYIKTIYTLESNGEKPTTKRIAAQMGVKMASVTAMVKHLAAEGYLRHRPYYGVFLREKGRRVALSTLRRHRLIELFLVKTLGVTWDEVHDDAEVLEHAISDRLIERIHEFLDQPEFDPHGSPIPTKDGTIRKLDGVKLNELPTGAKGRILQVSDTDDEFLRYLTSVGLAVGTNFTLVHREPFGGPLALKVASTTLSLGPQAAERILVAPTGSSRDQRKRPKKFCGKSLAYRQDSHHL